jgi:hypothetical protein
MDPLRPTGPESTDPAAEQMHAPDSAWARPEAGPTDGDTTTAVPTVSTGQPQVASGAAVTTDAAAVAPATAIAPAAAIAPPAKRRGSGRWLNVVLAVAACVAIGGVAFAIGRGTASASTATGSNRGGFATNGNGNGRPFGSFAPGANGNPGFLRGGGFGGGGLTLSGTVESVTADSITIKTANGQTITVGTGADTTYHTSSPASASDVTTGKTVQVQVGLTGRGNGNGGANGGNGGPAPSGAPAGPVGTADSVTVVP